MGDTGAPRRHYDVLAVSTDWDDRTLLIEPVNDSSATTDDPSPRRSEDLMNQR